MFEPVPLNLPPYPFKLKKGPEQTFIFDPLRKKYLVLTPEEWVRQHLVQFLINYKNYPAGLIKLEGGLALNSLQKRTDLIAFNSDGSKVLLVECKAPTVKINQKVFDQIARYNFVHRVETLVVSNGIVHFCCRIDFENKCYNFLSDIPSYLKK